MQARLTAYPPDNAAIVRAIRPGDIVRIGRAHDSELRIDHPSVSRIHAELRHQDGAWRLRDLGSKNGSYVDGRTASDDVLPAVSWLRFGDVPCEFKPLTDAEAAAERAGVRARRAAATAHTARIDGLRQLDELLGASLRGVLELAQCERGFVLLQEPDGLMVRTGVALDPGKLAARAFSGSIGAVQRALEQRRSVIVNDIGREAWLSSRASVATAGLSALVCVPLRDGERVLGAIYADRAGAGQPITVLDRELLEAFVERVALWITARSTSEQLRAQTSLAQESLTPGGKTQDWNSIIAAHGGDRP